MKFHYLARGIIYVNGKVLLAIQRGTDNTFLPGGHIGMGEKADAALIREISEEIGETAIVKQLQESHLEFMWVEPAELKAYDLQPYPLIECLMNWECGYHAYWGSSFRKDTSLGQGYAS